jgi:hypothetical protein
MTLVLRKAPGPEGPSSPGGSPGSEPRGALSSERWGWGPTALSEERGEHYLKN